ncbi:hypothetical protein ACLB2K_063541 [Fragaria x ananassa]
MAAASSSRRSGAEREEPASLIGGCDPFFYLCGRLLHGKPVAIPLFSAAVAVIWSLKERIMIWEEELGIFVFHFKNEKEKHQILGGGPWYCIDP